MWYRLSAVIVRIFASLNQRLIVSRSRFTLRVPGVSVVWSYLLVLFQLHCSYGVLTYLS